MKLTALKLTTFFILTASFTVMSSALIVSQNLMNVVSYWGESLKMTVYLKDSATPEEIQSVEQKLKSDDRLEKVEFVSSEAALDRFKE